MRNKNIINNFMLFTANKKLKNITKYFKSKLLIP